MSFEATTLARADRSLRDLDLSAEADKVEAIKADIARFKEAIQIAETRCNEIAEAVRDYRGPDGRRIADALLAKAAPGQAVASGPNMDEMEAERAALRSGIKDLQDRIKVHSENLEEVKSNALGRLNAALAPLVESIMSDARKAANSIIDAHVAMSAISTAFRSHGSETYSTRQAAERIAGHHGLLPWRREVDVPKDLAALIGAAIAKAPFLDVRAISPVQMP